MKILKDKVTVITGGTSGIGLATAKRFIAEGAKVVITGRSQNSLDKAITILGSDARGIISDVARLADLVKLKETISQYCSSIDVLFVNVGMSIGAPISDINEEQFDQLFNTNVKGSIFHSSEVASSYERRFI